MAETKLLEFDSAVGHLVSHLASSKSQSTLVNVESPSKKLSPESLHAKPWPSRPQVLKKGDHSHGWWDSIVDAAMILVPVPFFLLAVAVIVVDGKEVDISQLENLDRSIKGVTYRMSSLASKYC
jgi:hypothetical protein